MRLALLLAVFGIAIGSAASAAAQPFAGQSVLLGRYHVYQGAWCGHQDTGGQNVDEDCSFDTFEQCRRAAVGANNGFCTPNPAFTGYRSPPRKKKKRQAYR